MIWNDKHWCELRGVFFFWFLSNVVVLFLFAGRLMTWRRVSSAKTWLWEWCRRSIKIPPSPLCLMFLQSVTWYRHRCHTIQLHIMSTTTPPPPLRLTATNPSGSACVWPRLTCPPPHLPPPPLPPRPRRVTCLLPVKHPPACRKLPTAFSTTSRGSPTSPWPRPPSWGHAYSRRRRPPPPSPAIRKSSWAAQTRKTRNRSHLRTEVVTPPTRPPPS